MRTRSAGLVALVALLTAAACAGGGGGRSGAAPPELEDQPYAEVLELAIRDIQAFWTVTLPEVYDQEYEEIVDERIVPYESETDLDALGECAEGASYDDLAENASYCPADDTIVWDDEGLFPDLHQQFGVFALALVLAHEWGHAIQDQIGFEDPGIVEETQADCFAGAWTAWVERGESELVELDFDDLDRGVAGMLEVRDPVGFDPEAENAHGSGFDRVAAFQIGFEDGPEACTAWESNPPEFYELPFSDETDIERGGNLPFDEIVPTTTEDLDLFWSETLSDYEEPDDVVAYDPEDESSLPECGDADLTADDLDNQVFYCPADDFVAYDEPLLVEFHEEIGDFGVAVLLSGAWAETIQDQLDVNVDGAEQQLHIDCLTGLWAGTIPPVGDRSATFEYSPGDLDEVVQAFLARTAPDDEATVFARVAEYRSGFLARGDLEQCDA